MSGPRTLAEWRAHWQERARVADPIEAVGYGKMAPDEYRVLVIEPLLTLLALEPQHRVLEIGVGSGLLLRELEQRVALSIGSDLSEAFARRYCGRSPVLVADALTVPLDAAPFDRIVMNSVAHYFPSRRYWRAVVRRCVAHLAPRGRLVVGDVVVERHLRRGYYLHWRAPALVRFLENLGLPYTFAAQGEARRRYNRRRDLVIFKDAP